MAKTKFFAWRSGYHAKIAADVAGRELERIRKKNKGTLTADLVAAEAKPKSNPLHPQVYDLVGQALIFVDQSLRIRRSFHLSFEKLVQAGRLGKV